MKIFMGTLLKSFKLTIIHLVIDKIKIALKKQKFPRKNTKVAQNNSNFTLIKRSSCNDLQDHNSCNI
jgi:hypothetical protein